MNDQDWDGFSPNLLDPYVTELAWQNSILEAAGYTGWTCHHETDSRKSPKGFPDIVACHPTHGVIFLECKRERRPEPFTPAQRRWIWTLQASGQVAARVQPRHWKWVEAVLRGETRSIPDELRLESPP